MKIQINSSVAMNGEQIHTECVFAVQNHFEAFEHTAMQCRLCTVKIHTVNVLNKMRNQTQ